MDRRVRRRREARRPPGRIGSSPSSERTLTRFGRGASWVRGKGGDERVGARRVLGVDAVRASAARAGRRGNRGGDGRARAIVDGAFAGCAVRRRGNRVGSRARARGRDRLDRCDAGGFAARRRRGSRPGLWLCRRRRLCSGRQVRDDRARPSRVEIARHRADDRAGGCAREDGARRAGLVRVAPFARRPLRSPTQTRGG